MTVVYHSAVYQNKHSKLICYITCKLKDQCLPNRAISVCQWVLSCYSVSHFVASTVVPRVPWVWVVCLQPGLVVRWMVRLWL